MHFDRSLSLHRDCGGLYTSLSKTLRSGAFHLLFTFVTPTVVCCQCTVHTTRVMQVLRRRSVSDGKRRVSSVQWRQRQRLRRNLQVLLRLRVRRGGLRPADRFLCVHYLAGEHHHPRAELLHLILWFRFRKSWVMAPCTMVDWKKKRFFVCQGNHPKQVIISSSVDRF